jgi:hypothetical protein
MRSSRWMLMLLLLAAMPFAGCGNNRNSACEPCTNVDDCEAGLTCQQFRDANGNIRNLCGDANPNMTCPNN